MQALSTQIAGACVSAGLLLAPHNVAHAQLAVGVADPATPVAGDILVGIDASVSAKAEVRAFAKAVRQPGSLGDWPVTVVLFGVRTRVLHRVPAGAGKAAFDLLGKQIASHAGKDRRSDFGELAAWLRLAPTPQLVVLVSDGEPSVQAGATLLDGAGVVAELLKRGVPHCIISGPTTPVVLRRCVAQARGLAKAPALAAPATATPTVAVQPAAAAMALPSSPTVVAASAPSARPQPRTVGAARDYTAAGGVIAAIVLLIAGRLGQLRWRRQRRKPVAIVVWKGVELALSPANPLLELGGNRRIEARDGKVLAINALTPDGAATCPTQQVTVPGVVRVDATRTVLVRAPRAPMEANNV